MIYTVTLNPSIDFIVRIDKVEIGEVNRMESDDKFAGGKGINVSRILQRLGIDNTATGFIGGFTGRFVTDSLDAEGIKTKFVAVDQDTRINVKIKADQETEINGTGPVINDYQLAELEAILSSVSADDVVVFAGSAPSNLGNKVYNKLIPLVWLMLKNMRVKFLLRGHKTLLFQWQVMELCLSHQRLHTLPNQSREK